MSFNELYAHYEADIAARIHALDEIIQSESCKKTKLAARKRRAELIREQREMDATVNFAF